MNEIQFVNIAIDNWLELLSLSLLCVGILWLSVRSKLVAGMLDPLNFALVVAFGINYGVVLFLLTNELIEWPLFWMVAAYGLVFVLSFRWAASLQAKPLIYSWISGISDPRLSQAVFYSAVALYALISFLILYSIGFGIFAETNRYDAAKGYGSAIRILDALSPFIVSFAALTIMERKEHRLIKFGLLAVFILYAAIVNGAKASVILSFATGFLALTIASERIKITMWQAVGAVSVGMIFSLLALNINLNRNNVQFESYDPFQVSSNLLVSRLAYRFIAFGDTSYLTLPNRVIDNLQKDSVTARFVAPLVGNGNLSRMLGYETADFSVGRQAMLYYAPRADVGGGPTSHFDLFSYVYFGTVGGGFFVLALGWLLGRINRATFIAREVSTVQINKLQVSLIATLWSRAVLIIIEPTVALAYIVDLLAIFTAIAVFWSMILRSDDAGEAPAEKWRGVRDPLRR